MVDDGKITPGQAALLKAAAQKSCDDLRDDGNRPGTDQGSQLLSALHKFAQKDISHQGNFRHEARSDWVSQSM